MRHSVRLVRFGSNRLSSDEEQRELAEVLGGAPGTTKIEIVGPHAKGGYRATFDVAPEALGAHIAHLEAANWRLVV